MSIRSIQPITVAWMVLGAACTVSRAPWAWKKVLLTTLHKAAQPLSLTNVLHFQKNY